MTSLRVAFLHPDLGLGGAERLVVDAASGLSKSGLDVTMFTSYYDPNRCFEETKDGSFPVHVFGNWLPRHVLGKGHILFSTLRNLWLALRVAVSFRKFDVLIIDQISACIPLLRLLRPSSRVFFYCHFPDQLLAQPGSPLKRLYRIPFDALEEATTGMAQHIVVNSNFTRGVFQKTFKWITNWQRITPGVLHPCIEVDGSTSAPKRPIASRTMFLSINRFERKKAVHLALEAMVHLKTAVPADVFAAVDLVIAGGYDERVSENVQYYAELNARAQELGLTVIEGYDTPVPAAARMSATVRFVRSFTDAQKQELLQQCTAVLYTPSHEHFGIVPLETMAAWRPVIAVNNGGPLETVVTGETGFLVEPHPEAFAAAMAKFCRDPSLMTVMGRHGRVRVKANFSRQAFATSLENSVVNLVRSPPPDRRKAWVLLLGVVCVGLLALTAMAWAVVKLVQ